MTYTSFNRLIHYFEVAYRYQVKVKCIGLVIFTGNGGMNNFQLRGDTVNTCQEH